MGCASSAPAEPEVGPKSSPAQTPSPAQKVGSARSLPTVASGAQLARAPSVDLVQLEQLCARLEAVAAAAHATAAAAPPSFRSCHAEADAAEALRALCERLERVAETRLKPVVRRKPSYRI